MPLRCCVLGGTRVIGGQAGSPRRPNTQAAIPHAGADLAAENARLRRENERLRMEREILKKNAAHLLGSAEMKFRLIEDQREMFPVRVMCDVMGVSPAGYYAWRGRPESPRKTANRALLTEIRRVHAAHRGRYGAPRIHATLRAEGHKASRSRVERLMRHHGIRTQTHGGFRVCTTDSHHDLGIDTLTNKWAGVGDNSSGHEAHFLCPPPISARCHPARCLALPPVHLELPGCRGLSKDRRIRGWRAWRNRLTSHCVIL